ncbi:hypothetical protein [Evansella tamaricis]|uniref:Uncharacterized protein n=1 Tax=Evansella tamaricis TaxID=2069301 RepID=A0ABS6JL84_9BACI|nr:hypothetical protein [Evansella tamaricis]MBU9714356.1 hypothetical protein [Evansella tamaricis]
MRKNIFSVVLAAVVVIVFMIVFREPQEEASVFEGKSALELEREVEQLKEELAFYKNTIESSHDFNNEDVARSFTIVSSFLRSNSFEEVQGYFSDSVTFAETGDRHIISFSEDDLYEWTPYPSLELMDFAVEGDGIILYFEEELPEEYIYHWSIRLEEEEDWKINWITIDFDNPIFANP